MNLSCCGAPWPEGDERHYCELGKRTMRYVLEPRVQLRGPGQRLPEWKCSCKRADGRPLLRNYRHRSEWECYPQSVVDRWAARVGCSPKVAREMFWLELHFGR